jgi:ribonuclease HI
LSDLIECLSESELQNLHAKLTKLPDSNVEIVYTDGGCTKNGKHDALAGYSVYFTEGDTRNTTNLVPSNLQNTNNVAELLGIKKALELVNPEKEILLYTDSLYSIKCITLWSKGWIKNGWKNSKKENVKNKELIQEILGLLQTLKVTFNHVKSHMIEPKDRNSLEWRNWNGNFQCDKNVSNLLQSDTRWSTSIGKKPTRS